MIFERKRRNKHTKYLIEEEKEFGRKETKREEKKNIEIIFWNVADLINLEEEDWEQLRKNLI